ncbi:MAG: response regulator, partial [Caldilineaceae bacterium]|nr:response regulator [Caldilineaceae bacterium]
MTIDAASTGQTLTPPHILVVDDSRDAHTMLRARLGHAGFALTMATSGYEALELIEGHGLPDLIILDIMMPIKSGLQALEEIKADESLASIPVIMLTGLSEKLKIQT